MQRNKFQEIIGGGITKNLTNVNQTRLESLEASDSILDHQYQKKLMKDFIKDNSIDIKWELVDRLDNKVNTQIDKFINPKNPDAFGFIFYLTGDEFDKYLQQLKPKGTKKKPLSIERINMIVMAIV